MNASNASNESTEIIDNNFIAEEFNGIESLIESKVRNTTKVLNNNDDDNADNSDNSVGLNSKQKTLLYSTNGLINFYHDSTNKRILTTVCNQETPISLRLLDWLVTNYSKNYDVHYDLYENTNNAIGGIEYYVPSNKNFNLWKDYKNQLKSFSKKLFDPFCRRQRIFFNLSTYDVIALHENNFDTYEKNKAGIVTTVGQLNFFRWAIVNRVIDYAFDNLEKIESDMLISADNKTHNKSGKRQLSKINSSAKSQKLKIIVQFS